MRYLVCVFLLFAACQPDPTPFPVSNLPTATSLGTVAAANAPQPIRYALAPNMAETVAEIEAAVTAAQVEMLTEPLNIADLGTRFDVMVMYGDLVGAVRSPLTPHIALVVNLNFPPFDNAVLADIFHRALNPQIVVNMLAIPGVNTDEQMGVDPLILRIELANAGLPDGFELVGASVSALGSAALQATLHTAGIDSRWGTLNPEALAIAFGDGRVHLALVTWTTPEQRTQWETLAGVGNLIDLFSVPISYLAMDGLTITFTSTGFPVATR